MTRPTLGLDSAGKLCVKHADGRAESLASYKTSVQTVPHVAYLVIDCSSSMTGSMPSAVEGSLAFFDDALKKGYYVGVIRFASLAQLECEPTRDRAVITAKLTSLDASGSTNMTQALEVATHCLSIGKFPRAIILVTDGRPDSPAGTQVAAKRARDAGIDVIAIGTGDADQTFLDTLVSRSGLAVTVARAQLAQSIGSAARLLAGR